MTRCDGRTIAVWVWGQRNNDLAQFGCRHHVIHRSGKCRLALRASKELPGGDRETRTKLEDKRYKPANHLRGPNPDMCLAIPMEVKQIDEFVARCEAKGVERDVSLFMMQGEDVQPGDFVMVHVGYAIQKVSPQDARSAWELFDEIIASTEG